MFGLRFFRIMWTRVTMLLMLVKGGGNDVIAAVSSFFVGESLRSEWGAVRAGRPAWGAVAGAGAARVAAEWLLGDLVVLGDLMDIKIAKLALKKLFWLSHALKII